MLVVADASPFVALLQIGEVEVLPALFGTVTVPQVVLDELRAAARPVVVRAFAASTPHCLQVRDPRITRPFHKLHAGEEAAIGLALEIDADLLLIDDRDGIRVARQHGLATARTAAVMLQAANAGSLADLAAAFERLKGTDFRVPRSVLDDLLEVHRRTRTT